MDEESELLKAVCEIRDLVRLLAEPAIAERDRSLRAELRRVVGKSAAKSAAVLRMDGSRTQAQIQRETKINQGDLSSMVKKLKEAKLITGDGKRPTVAISIPSTFFDGENADE